MNVLPGILLRLALGTAIGLNTLIFQQWLASAVLGLMLLLSFLPWKAEIDRIGQIMVLLTCAVLAWILASVIGPRPDHPISPALALFRAVLSVFALLYSLAQLYFSNPFQGALSSTAAGLFAVLALGGSKTGALYPAAAGAYVMIALGAMALDDPGRTSFKRLDGRIRLYALGILCGAWIVAIGTFVALPAIHKWVSDRIQLAFTGQKTGFSPYFELGSLSDIATNDTVVLRVFGPKPDHLRGIVYSQYHKGRWVVGKGHLPNPVRVRHIAEEQTDQVRIRKVSGDYDFYFLPLSAKGVQVAAGEIRGNEYGIASAKTDEEPGLVQFSLGRRDGLEVAPPRELDTAVPKEMAKEIREIAQAWVGGEAEVQGQLVILAEKLKAQYSYSLKSERATRKDPVLDFLTQNKKGHCEYFASAMALLARSLGIPTRVVAGYRVNERNRFGGYHVVREKDAHAWVEAWIPEVGWQTYDPTPSLTVFGLRESRSGILAGLSDYLAAKLSIMQESLARITFFQMSIGVLGLVLFWIGLRLVRRFGRDRSLRLATEIEYSEALPEILTLLEKLEQLGESLGKSEPLEQFARRVADSKRLGKRGAEIESLLMRYSAFRYGKVGNEREIAADIREWVGSV